YWSSDVCSSDLSAGRRLEKLGIDARGETRRHLHPGLERPGENQTALGGLDHGAGGGHPYAAAGKPPLQISDDLAIRRGDETDERIRRHRLAADGTGTFAGPAAAR